MGGADEPPPPLADKARHPTRQNAEQMKREQQDETLLPSPSYYTPYQKCNRRKWDEN